MTENVVKFPATSLDLQKTVENIASNDVQHAIVITLNADNSFKVHTTADPDLTAELLWDSLTLYEGKADNSEVSGSSTLGAFKAEIAGEEMKLCPTCGLPE